MERGELRLWNLNHQEKWKYAFETFLNAVIEKLRENKINRKNKKRRYTQKKEERRLKERKSWVGQIHCEENVFIDELWRERYKEKRSRKNKSRNIEWYKRENVVPIDGSGSTWSGDMENIYLIHAWWQVHRRKRLSWWNQAHVNLQIFA